MRSRGRRSVAGHGMESRPRGAWATGRPGCLMRVGLAALALACGGVSASTAVAQTPPASSTVLGSAVSSTPVIDAVRERFSKTRSWFRLVETLSFARASDGHLTPTFATLSHPRIRVADGAGRTILPSFAPHFGGRMRLESGPTHLTRIDVEPIGARDVAATVEQGLVVYAGAYRDTDVLYKATPTHTDEYLFLRTERAPHRWRFKILRGAGAVRVRQAGNSIEIVDENGAAMMRATPPVAVDTEGHRVDGTIRLAGGDVIVVDLPVEGLTFPVLVDPDWASTGDMAYGRFYHQANVLPDGFVLITGGCSASVCSGDLSIPACRAVVQAAEVLSMETRTFARAAESASPRFFQVAESLVSGDVLVVGGCVNADCSETVWAPELFSAATRTFSAIPDTDGLPLAGLASVRLQDGRVLLAGGCTRAGCQPRVDVYDPTSGHIDPVAPMHFARGRAPAVLLGDGRVLVVGGCTDIDCTTPLGSAEVYDPVANTWTSTGPMATARAGHFATALSGGRAIVGGGCATQHCEAVLRSVELFDPSTMAFVATSSLQQPRVGPVALTLPDGTVLINQGCGAAARCDLTNELFDPLTSTFALVAPAVTPRAFQATVIHSAAHLVVSNGGCQPSTCSWWNETWDISSLVPTDGGTTTLDGGLPDAGRPDLGPRPHFDANSGCSCRVSEAPSGRTPWLWLGLFGALIARIRRRRR